MYVEYLFQQAFSPCGNGVVRKGYQLFHLFGFKAGLDKNTYSVLLVIDNPLAVRTYVECGKELLYAGNEGFPLLFRG